MKPPTPDPNLKDNRWDHVYIPEGGVNVVSPMLSMKYNLSKDKMKMQHAFTSRLQRALLEEKKDEKPPVFEQFYCRGCNGLLFSEKDIVFHAPVFVSSYVPSKLKIMEGDTSNVALLN